MPILHTTTSGKGPIIVMVHGFLSSSRYFRAFRKRFEDEYTIITVDLLGSGRSVRPNNSVTYDSQIEALHQTLRQFQSPFILLGHSMGAVLATRYAITFPNDISSLILFNPPLFSSEEEARESIEATGLHYRAILTHPRSRLLWRGMKLLPRAPQKIAPPLGLSNSVSTHRYAREGAYQNIILQAEFIHDLKALTQPTTLISGDRDRYVYQKTLDALSVPSNVDIKRIATGHHTIIRAPDLAETLVRAHLEHI